MEVVPDRADFSLLEENNILNADFGFSSDGVAMADFDPGESPSERGPVLSGGGVFERIGGDLRRGVGDPVLVNGDSDRAADGVANAGVDVMDGGSGVISGGEGNAGGTGSDMPVVTFLDKGEGVRSDSW